jgi:Zn finger protein HypA/HybF involved in hydrogenase expression
MESLFINTIAFPQAVPYLASTPDPRCGHCGKQISRKATLALCPNCTLDAFEDISGERTRHISVLAQSVANLKYVSWL